MAQGEHPNCQAIEDFLEAIPSISRPICQTAKFGNTPVSNAFVAAWHEAEKNCGFTIIAFGQGQMKLVIELTGDLAEATDLAAQVNKVFFTK